MTFKGEFMKVKVLILVIAAVFLFQSSSPWEGAAGVASNGELPISGFFIATNSFPRNTVVDITNIETGRSTRAIVGNNLNNSGLLAIVSRDAAQLIGMRAGSVSRIRIVAPSDPLAYQRFTEGLAHDIPPFDSGQVIRSEAEVLADVYAEDPFSPEDFTQTARPPAQAARNEFTGPSYVAEPEWGGSARLEIVDIPRFREPEPVRIREPVQVVTPPVAEPTPVVTAPPVLPPVTPPPLFVQEDVIKDVPPIIAEGEYPYIVKDVPVYIADQNQPVLERRPIVPEAVVKAVPEFSHEHEAAEIVKAVPEFKNDQPVMGFDAVVKDVAEFTREQEAAELTKDISQFEEAAVVQASVPAERPLFDIVSAEPRPPEPFLHGIDPNDIIPGIAIRTPQQAPAAPERPIVPAAEPPFSIRTISQLDRGQYYVQIAALPVEHINNLVRDFDPQVFHFDPVVFRNRDNQYSILIGPLNQGESAAVLARFRSIGYRDAFVRRGG